MKNKNKNTPSVIRELFTNAFFQYYLKKMSITEFVIRLLRIDIVSNGQSKENIELLNIIRNYNRGIKENCICPATENKQLSLKEFLTQRKREKQKYKKQE